MGSYDTGGYSAGYYIDPSDTNAKNIKAFKDQFYSAYYPANAAYWAQAAIDKRFKVGDQSLWSMIYGDNNWYQARRFFFNLIRRHINLISGYQRRNRKSTVTLPTQNNTDPLADEYNKVLKWCEERDGFQEYLSQSFEWACDVGSNWLHLYPSYVFDPISGDLFTDQVAYCNILTDSNFRKQDLSDCIGIWRRRWIDKTGAKTLLPGHAKEIEKMRPGGTKDGRFPLQAELLNIAAYNLFAMDEFHYRTTREATMIIDPKSGEAVEWEDEEGDEPDTMERVLQQQPWLQVKKMQVPTVKCSISVGDRVFYDGPTLLGIDNYPYIPNMCYYEPDIQSYAWRIQGIIRNLRDTQYLYNSRMVIMEDILRSQINSGWVYPVDAVVDPKAFRQSGQGFLVPLKAGHTKDELQRIDPPSIPNSMMDLANMLSEDITKISGVNEELLGSATDDKAGILSMLRQGAGLTTLQGIFDKLDYSQRLYGKIRLEAIRKNFTKGKVAFILGKEPSASFFSSHSLKYSIAVEEGNYSTTQRQMELQQLLHFREIGMPISDKRIMAAAFITNKAEIIQEMEQSAQAQAEAQQAQMAEESKKNSAEVFTKFAKGRSDLAKEKELMASAHEKIAKISDIQANAEHKKAQADMELVKMMLELETMDLETIRSSFEIAESIKIANNPELQKKPKEAI